MIVLCMTLARHRRAVLPRLLSIVPERIAYGLHW